MIDGKIYGCENELFKDDILFCGYCQPGNIVSKKTRTCLSKFLYST